MMKRIFMLTTLALMVVAAMALSGVAQAAPTIEDPADARCLAEAAKTLGKGFKPANYTFHGGTDEVADDFSAANTTVADVFCGFGGDDRIERLEAGDIFLGGEGADVIPNNNSGTFNGGEGNDSVNLNVGTFNGGAGTDFVTHNHAAGTFNGEAGNDSVLSINEGTFNGGEGNDSVNFNHGTFNGGAGTDSVTVNFGTFNQDAP
jgi:hypothetical protein